MHLFTSLRLLGSLSTLAIALLLTACGSAPPTAPTATPAGSTGVHRFDGGSIDVSTRNGDCRLTLHGDIQSAAVRRMGSAFDSIEQAQCKRKTLVLDSGNGWLGDAITLGAMAHNRGYDTEVKAGSTCYTPCLLVFAAGQNRVLPDAPVPARLGFSQIPPDQDFGRHQCNTELTQGQHLTLTRYLKAMLPSNTATAVYQKLLAATCDRTDTYGPAEALALGLATATR
ncbi:MAG TPA: hypothetical protein VFY31_08530 [Macromonas sp.]|nr:hypothetical protein [Macromonas sp.]